MLMLLLSLMVSFKCLLSDIHLRGKTSHICSTYLLLIWNYIHRFISAYESKAIFHHTNAHREMRDLYNSTSFSAYVNYVLDSPYCYDILSDRCNEHIRSVKLHNYGITGLGN